MFVLGVHFEFWDVFSFEFLVCGGMNGPTNLAVVDLSPYGFVFKELALQTLILSEFLSFLFFGYFVTNHLAHPDSMGCVHPIKSIPFIDLLLCVHFEFRGVFGF